MTPELVQQIAELRRREAELQAEVERLEGEQRSHIGCADCGHGIAYHDGQYDQPCHARDCKCPSYVRCGRDVEQRIAHLESQLSASVEENARQGAFIESVRRIASDGIIRVATTARLTQLLANFDAMNPEENS
jgi:hypothetical protein